jgi:hypothetical protein
MMGGYYEKFIPCRAEVTMGERIIAAIPRLENMIRVLPGIISKTNRIPGGQDTSAALAAIHSDLMLVQASLIDIMEDPDLISDVEREFQDEREKGLRGEAPGERPDL